MLDGAADPVAVTSAILESCCVKSVSVDLTSPPLRFECAINEAFDSCRPIYKELFPVGFGRLTCHPSRDSRTISRKQVEGRFRLADRIYERLGMWMPKGSPRNEHVDVSNVAEVIELHRPLILCDLAEFVGASHWTDSEFLRKTATASCIAIGSGRGSLSSRGRFRSAPDRHSYNAPQWRLLS